MKTQQLWVPVNRRQSIFLMPGVEGLQLKEASKDILRRRPPRLRRTASGKADGHEELPVFVGLGRV